MLGGLQAGARAFPSRLLALSVTVVVLIIVATSALGSMGPVGAQGNGGGNEGGGNGGMPNQEPTAAPSATPSPTPTARPIPTEPPPDADEVRVAFLADTGYSTLSQQQLAYPSDYLDLSLSNPGRVLKLIKAEGAELTLHGGDIGYDELGSATPEKWNLQVDQILGANYPLFASAGNHDRRHWDAAPPSGDFLGLGYSDVLETRYAAVLSDPSVVPGLSCTFANGTGDIGRKATCTYKSITFVTAAIGNWESPTNSSQADNSYEAYLKSSLEAATTPWLICNWHFNQTKFQTGFKTNEAGWKPYEYCRENGAIIATGHEHSYARTHLMGRFAEDSNPGDIVTSGPNLTLDEGNTLAWVSGLGGVGIRTVSDQVGNPWWAKTLNTTNLSSSNGAGVLFCDFGTTIGDSQASCFYKTIDGVVRDRFELVSNANGGTGVFEVPYVDTNIAPTVNPLGPLTAVAGNPVTVAVSAQDFDGPKQLDYWAVDLPPGLSISRTFGTISGTPTTPNTSTSTIYVWDGATSTEIQTSWQILPPPTPTPTPTPLPTPTPTATPTPTPTPLPTATPTPTPAPTVPPTATPRPTATSTATPTPTTIPTPTTTVPTPVEFTPTAVPSPTVIPSPTPSVPTPVPSPTAAEFTPTATPTVLPPTPGARLTCQNLFVTVDLNLGQVPTDGDDVILGTPGDDVIAAGAGDDVVCGRDGNDSIWGQAGDDRLYGENGDDKLRGGDGVDWIYGGDDSDDLSGGRDNDRVYGQLGDDIAVRGGTGDDLVDGGGGDDLLVNGNGGIDIVRGGTGNDLKVNGGPRPDEIDGGSGNDVIKGNGGADVIIGGDGDDEILGGPQPDNINGGAGDDQCNGGTTGDGAIESDSALACELMWNVP